MRRGLITAPVAAWAGERRRLQDAADGGGPSCTMVVGRVVKVHVNRAVYDEANGVVVAEALRPMSRLGGNTYGTLGDIFDLARPTVGGRAAEGGAGAKGT